jgi:hypothetical protein
MKTSQHLVTHKSFKAYKVISALFAFKERVFLEHTNTELFTLPEIKMIYIIQIIYKHTFTSHPPDLNHSTKFITPFRSTSFTVWGMKDKLYF